MVAGLSELQKHMEKWLSRYCSVDEDDTSERFNQLKDYMDRTPLHLATLAEKDPKALGSKGDLSTLKYLV